MELGSWRLQSTSLRLRRQDFKFLRDADEQLVLLGQGATAKARGAGHSVAALHAAAAHALCVARAPPSASKVGVADGHA